MFFGLLIPSQCRHAVTTYQISIIILFGPGNKRYYNRIKS